MQLQKLAGRKEKGRIVCIVLLIVNSDKRVPNHTRYSGNSLILLRILFVLHILEGWVIPTFRSTLQLSRNHSVFYKLAKKV